jgi:hypothetical protein
MHIFSDDSLEILGFLGEFYLRKPTNREYRSPSNSSFQTLINEAIGELGINPTLRSARYSMVAKMQNAAKFNNITFSEITQNCPELSSQIWRQNSQFERTELFGRRSE